MASPNVNIGAVQDSTLFLELDMPHLQGNILLVEDESFVLEVTAEILQAAGYQVLKARHAAEAMRIFRQNTDTIELLVLDVVLPGRNGWELARELIHLHPQLKIVFVSGYPENANTRTADFGHKVVYLPKPFSVNSLMQKVREAIVAQ